MNSQYKKSVVNRTYEPTRTETISELAHRHLRDKNHTTTDEELRNARIELSNMSSVKTKGIFCNKKLEKYPFHQ